MPEELQQPMATFRERPVRSAERSGEPRIKSVALVAPAWPPDRACNGIVGYVANLKIGLEQHGVRAQVVTRSLLSEGTDAVDAVPFWQHAPMPVRAWGAVLWRLRGDEAFRPLYARRTIVPALQHVVKTAGVDLVEMEESFGLARHVIEALNVPVVIKLHGPWFVNGKALGLDDQRASRRRVHDEGLAIAAAAGVSAPSQDILDQTRRYYGLEMPDASVIPCSIVTKPAAEHWRLDACDHKRLAFVGRFDRIKGGDTVIDAFALLAAADDQVTLDFVGPDRGVKDDAGRTWKLQEYIAHRVPAAFRGRIHVHGPAAHHELDRFRRGAIVTIAPSRCETFCYTVAEAMAVGAPVVASRAGALPELIQPESNGLLCTAGDAADLARHVMTLLKDPSKAQRFGRQAAVDCQARYSPATVAQQTIAFYEKVIQRWSKGPRGS
jgi:glycosyltransferase involved in cell wall biosynthesis